jgi:uncharacterized membrane protein YbaN (DUF454 family)
MSANVALKTILFILGWVSFVLGIVGALLPIVPTTPFLILAAYFFSKSSPKVHSWLTSLPYFGDAIIDWEKHRVIRPKAKVISTVVIIMVFGASILLGGLHTWLKLMLVIIAACCLGFIWSRKSEQTPS